MHLLRRSRFLACIVLAWFAAHLCTPVLGTWIAPVPTELICSGAGVVKLLAHTAEGVQEHGDTSADCVLCLNLGAPPTTSQTTTLRHVPQGHTASVVSATRTAARTAAPLPPRGPPTFS